MYNPENDDFLLLYDGDKTSYIDAGGRNCNCQPRNDRSGELRQVFGNSDPSLQSRSTSLGSRWHQYRHFLPQEYEAALSGALPPRRRDDSHYVVSSSVDSEGRWMGRSVSTNKAASLSQSRRSLSRLTLPLFDGELIQLPQRGRSTSRLRNESTQNKSYCRDQFPSSSQRKSSEQLTVHDYRTSHGQSDSRRHANSLQQATNGEYLCISPSEFYSRSRAEFQHQYSFFFRSHCSQL